MLLLGNEDCMNLVTITRNAFIPDGIFLEAYSQTRLQYIPIYKYPHNNFSLIFNLRMFDLMTYLRVLILLPMFSFVFPQENSNFHVLPRPLIVENIDLSVQNHPSNDEEPKEAFRTQDILKEVVELPGKADFQVNEREEDNDELFFKCSSWRFAVESNNLSPWKAVPEDCRNYVKEYMKGRGYVVDLERVSQEAILYAKNVELGGDGMDVWVFDIDETLLSNLHYYELHGHGSELFDSKEFDKWVEKAIAPAIQPSLELYKEVLKLGFKIFLLTGRSEKQRNITIQNLINAGFYNWDKLILRASNDHGKLAVIFKSEKRSEMVNEGYRIVGNSGDQWSDLLGSPMSVRSFKLPNPMYYIP